MRASHEGGNVVLLVVVTALNVALWLGVARDFKRQQRAHKELTERYLALHRYSYSCDCRTLEAACAHVQG